MINFALVLKKEENGQFGLYLGVILSEVIGVMPDRKGVIKFASICYFKEGFDSSTGYIRFLKTTYNESGFISIDNAIEGDDIYCLVENRSNMIDFISKNIDDKEEKDRLISEYFSLIRSFTR